MLLAIGGIVVSAATRVLVSLLIHLHHSAHRRPDIKPLGHIGGNIDAAVGARVVLAGRSGFILSRRTTLADVADVAGALLLIANCVSLDGEAR